MAWACVGFSRFKVAVVTTYVIAEVTKEGIIEP